MSIKNSILIAVTTIILVSCNSQQKKSDTVKAPYDGSWESLQQMPVPDWFNDGKIGIFIHWGPYSVIGHRKDGRGYAEHVPKLIYTDSSYYYPYLRERWGAAPPEFGYKDIIPEFKAENWNPDAWAKLFDEVGAKYVVLTAEHHDGWANWDSDLTPWNAKDKGPKRDLVGDLGKAVKEQGLKYAPFCHRERHTSFFTTKQYVVDARPHADILEEIKRSPEAESLYGPFGFSKEAIDEYVARWKEIQEKYQPDFLWIDDIPIFTRDGNNTQVEPKVFMHEIQYLYDQCRSMITDFMNNGNVNNQEVYLNNKGKNRNWPDGIGCLEKDNLKLEVIGPKWQSCTAEYAHPHWYAEAPERFPGKKASADIPQHRIKAGETRAFAQYEIHEPKQNAYGDWASISMGGQYYLFADFDPAGGHGRNSMSVSWFASDDINKPFTFCGNIVQGHPDPDILFAEGKFHLCQQMNTDYISPGPWVETVEVRVGVDTTNDGDIDRWSDCQEVKEHYGYMEGFAKQIKKTSAILDVSELRKGYGFQFEDKVVDTTENESKPILDNVVVAFE